MHRFQTMISRQVNFPFHGFTKLASEKLIKEMFFQFFQNYLFCLKACKDFKRFLEVPETLFAEANDNCDSLAHILRQVLLLLPAVFGMRTLRHRAYGFHHMEHQIQDMIVITITQTMIGQKDV